MIGTRKTKSIILLVLAFVLSCSSTINVYAGEWVKGNFGIMYRNSDGSYPRSEFIYHNGSWYLLDVMGKPSIGWRKWQDKWYYLDQSGIMVRDGIVNIYGIDYTFDSSGAWVEDEVSRAAGRNYQSKEYNLEITLPYYFEMDIDGYLMPLFKDSRDVGDYYFYVGLGEFHHNSTVDDVVEREKARNVRWMFEITEHKKVTINNREYTKLVVNDPREDYKTCYQDYYYDTGASITSIRFSYNPDFITQAEVDSIIATARPLSY